MRFETICLLILLYFSANCVEFISASNGDRTQFFHNCRQNCERQNCSDDGIEIQEQAVKYYQQSFFDEIFRWTCADECQYGCMWTTVEAYLERGWVVPQFYGKWPFVRFLGLQEPASVLFSLLNFIANLYMLKKFRREVRPDSPCYNLWHIFACICLNGWIWSTIFHARDFPLTELLDYAFAYSIVLANLYGLVIRMIHKKSIILRGLVTLIFLSYFINYFAYLSVGKFNYSLNMKVNIITGVLSAVGWLCWSYFVRHDRPYYFKIVRFYILFGLAMSLEVLDFPPIYWLIDAHSLWHLTTASIVPMFYDFVISDCKALRKEKMQQLEKFDKDF